MEVLFPFKKEKKKGRSDHYARYPIYLVRIYYLSSANLLPT